MTGIQRAYAEKNNKKCFSYVLLFVTLSVQSQRDSEGGPDYKNPSQELAIPTNLLNFNRLIRLFN